MKINDTIPHQFPFLLLFLVTLGMFTNDTQGILNISVVLLFLYTLITLLKNKINIKDDLIALIKTRKIFFLFGFWGLFCATFFTYPGFTLEAIKAFFDDWRYIIIIVLFLITFKKEQEKTYKTITYALIFTLAFTIFIVPILKQFKSSELPLYLQLRYGFAHYMTLLFPFTFSALFLLKKKILKAAMLLLSILAFLFLLYTGSRGAVLAVIIEASILLLILSSSYKKLILNIASFGILVIAVIFTSYHYIPQVKNKVNQSLYAADISSSRGKIIETRYPIFTQNTAYQLMGVGYGSVAYNQFLFDNKAPKFSGGMGYSRSKKESFYNNDEPFFLNISYSIGLIGLILFLAAFFINMKDLFKSIRVKKDILNVGIFVSSIGYFLVYCLFEFVFIDIFIFYNILTAILIRKTLTR